MTLQYKDYTITGNVEEIIEFIKANEPITFSNGSTVQYMGKIMSNAINEAKLFEEEPGVCEPNIEQQGRK